MRDQGAVLPQEPEKPATKNPEFGVFTVPQMVWDEKGR